MTQHEQTSKRLASIAGRILKSPHTATDDEIKELAASVLTQYPGQRDGDLPCDTEAKGE